MTFHTQRPLPKLVTRLVKREQERDRFRGRAGSGRRAAGLCSTFILHLRLVSVSNFQSKIGINMRKLTSSSRGPSLSLPTQAPCWQQVVVVVGFVVVGLVRPLDPLTFNVI